MTNEIQRMEKLLGILEAEKSKGLELKAEEKLNLKILKEDYGCVSIAEANELLEQLEEEAEEAQEAIKKDKQSLMAEMSKYGYL